MKIEPRFKNRKSPRYRGDFFLKNSKIVLIEWNIIYNVGRRKREVNIMLQQNIPDEPTKKIEELSEQEIIQLYDDFLAEVEDNFYSKIQARKLIVETCLYIVLNMLSSSVVFFMLKFNSDYFAIRCIAYLIGGMFPASTNIADLKINYDSKLELNNLQVFLTVAPKFIINFIITEVPIREHRKIILDSQESIAQIEIEIEQYYQPEQPRDFEFPLFLVGSSVVAVGLLILNRLVRN